MRQTCEKTTANLRKSDGKPAKSVDQCPRFIVELDDGRIIGIEVKSSSSFKGDQFAGLRALASKAGSRFAAGIVFGTGQSSVQHAEGLWGLPISALWECRLG